MNTHENTTNCQLQTVKNHLSSTKTKAQKY